MIVPRTRGKVAFRERLHSRPLSILLMAVIVVIVGLYVRRAGTDDLL